MLKQLLFVFTLMTTIVQASIVELIELGSFEQAEKQLLDQLATTSNNEERIVLRTLYGDVWFYRNQFDKAIDQYKQALALAEVVNNKALQAEQMKNIGIAFAELKFYGKALKWQELAKTTLDFELVNNTGMSILLSQAMIFTHIGAPELGVETLGQAQNIAYQLSNHSGLNNSYLRMAALLMKKHSFEEAKNRLQKVELNSLSNLNDLLWYYQLRLSTELNLNNLIEAEDVHNEFLKIATGSDYLDDFRIKLLTVHLQIQKGDFHFANELIKALEQDNSLSSWQIIFLKAQFFKAQNKHLTAFDYYQESVDLFFHEQAHEKHSDLYTALPISLLKDTISAALDVGFDDLEQIFEWLNWLYRAKQPKFSNQSMAEQSKLPEGVDLGFSEVVTDVVEGQFPVAGYSALNLSALQRALKSDEGFVFYMGLNNQLLAFMVGIDSIELIELHHDFKSLNDQISQLLNLLSQNDAWVPLSQKLERQLIYPLRAYGLDDFKKLYIVPDENLRFVPFDALLDEQGETMLNKHTISFQTIHSLPQFIANRNQGEQAAIMGDLSKASRLSFVGNMSAMVDVPSYWRTAYRNLDFQPQPFTGVKNEHALIKSMRLAGKILLNQMATESNAVELIKQETGVLHVASHGFDNPLAPAFSALVLTANNHDDGLLQAREVSKLKTHLSLVVLASCSSAKGGLQGRYGFQLGLSEAFLQAGAKSVVGTLWDVKDQKTYQFMQWFYQFLKEVHQPLLALNLAKRKAVDEQWQVIDWSAFILLGDGTNPIKLNTVHSTETFLYQHGMKLLILITCLLSVAAFFKKALKNKR